MREIGILKAFKRIARVYLGSDHRPGAVKRWSSLGVGGTVVGIGLSFAARALIHALYPAFPDASDHARLVAHRGRHQPGGCTAGSSLSDSAAAQDPIEALAYE